jgi:hypothetical protein
MQAPLECWRSEKTAGYLSSAVAAAEPDPKRAALFAVGAVLSLFSGRSAFVGGARMLLIGSAAAAATYMIGSLFNVSGI